MTHWPVSELMDMFQQKEMPGKSAKEKDHCIYFPD